MRRKLTKQEKFDIDIIYRPYLIEYRNRFKRTPYKYWYELEKLSHLRVLEIFSENLSHYFENKDKDEFYLFLSDYEDLLNWKKILPLIINMGLHYKDLVNCIDLFKEHLDSESWTQLSCNYSCYNDENFIRRFKDKIDWKIITRNHRWDNLDFILEMKDYIDIYYIFKNIDISGDVKCFVIPYIEEHFEDMIKYAIVKEKEYDELGNN